MGASKDAGVNQVLITEAIFVSDQKDAIVGRLMRECKEAEAELLSLTAEATRFGITLEEIGKRLQSEPEFVVFQTQETSVRYSSLNLENATYKAGDISGQQVLTLTHGIRSAMDRVRGLREEARTLGF
jgi:hypothetical protein